MVAPITHDVLSEILRAYAAEEPMAPSNAALKALADASEMTVQAVKNRYLALYQAAGHEDDPFAPFAGPMEDDPRS